MDLNGDSVLELLGRENLGFDDECGVTYVWNSNHYDRLPENETLKRQKRD